jgi:hypothetical protein
MPYLENPRHERFAQLRASGTSGSEAYRTIMGRDARNADVRADQLTSKPGVRERVEELKAESAKKCSMSREEFVESLVEMYRSAPGDASLTNPLCDSLISRGVRHAVFPMKTTVAAQLAKLCGWDAATKVEVEAGSELASLLGRLFAGGATLGSSNGNDGNGERTKEASGFASGRRH